METEVLQCMSAPNSTIKVKMASTQINLIPSKTPGHSQNSTIHQDSPVKMQKSA